MMIPTRGCAPFLSVLLDTNAPSHLVRLRLSEARESAALYGCGPDVQEAAQEKVAHGLRNQTLKAFNLCYDDGIRN